MLMKKKFIIITLSVLLLVGLYLVLRQVVPFNSTKLQPPNIVSLNSYTLTWDTVEGAVGYEVDVDGEKINAKKTTLNLKYSHNGKSVKIRALGDGISCVNSDFSKPITVIFEESMLERADYVNYVVTDAGFTVKEFNYYNEFIDVSSIDLSQYGLNFLGWYRIIDENVIPVKENFVASGTINLYAETEYIVYNVAYEFGDFTVSSNLPTTYTVKTVGSLLSPTSSKDGYKIVGWCLDEKGENLLSKNDLIIGDLTLYPRISLINEGLSFEKCDGGYAVKSYVGEDKVLHVPKKYLGENVVKVLPNAITGFTEETSNNTSAFDGTNAPFIEEIIFYGEISLSRESITACLNLKRCEFLSSVNIEEKAFMFAKSHYENSMEFVFKDEVNLHQNFFAFYLDLAPDVEFKIFVKSEYYLDTCLKFSQKATVEELV